MGSKFVATIDASLVPPARAGPDQRHDPQGDPLVQVAVLHGDGYDQAPCGQQNRPGQR